MKSNTYKYDCNIEYQMHSCPIETCQKCNVGKMYQLCVPSYSGDSTTESTARLLSTDLFLIDFLHVGTTVGCYVLPNQPRNRGRRPKDSSKAKPQENDYHMKEACN